MKDKILAALSEACPWQASVLWFDSIDSTNTRAKAMADAGAPEGTILIAGQQTGGRGRRGRSFSSPAGSGVYLSLILRPDCTPDKLMHLTCATAVAACDAVEKAAGFRPGIKWTNDLVSHSRKLCGILTELGFDGRNRISYAIVGIGINCLQTLSDFPEELQDMAGSLSMIAGRRIEPAAAAAAMIEALYTMNRDLLTEKDAIMARYRRDCMTLGTDISLRMADGSVRYGHALDLSADGGLIVRFEDGTLETVSSGEVSVRGLYGYA